MNRIQRVAISYLVVILVLVWGYAIGRYQVFPYGLVESKVDELVSFYEGSPEVDQTLVKKVTDLAEEKTFGVPVQHLAAEYGSPHLTLEPGIKIKPDELLQLTTWWKDGLHIRLLDHDGKLFKKWKIDPQTMKLNFDSERSQILGALILPNGSLLFTNEEFGLVKTDKCGMVLWSVRDLHHKLDLTVRDTIWGVRLDSKEENKQTIQAPYDDHTLVEIDQFGTILNSISFIDLLYENGLYALMFANGQSKVTNVHYDISHVNDVEELSPELANQFPLFSRGDIMVSARNLNLIIVLDPRTRIIKWYQVGPFLRHHDPDFQPDGTITLFNNNTDNSFGEIHGGSSILAVDPLSRSVRLKYQAPGFYSSHQGEHQLLADGRMLIVESTRGRVFMINKFGKLIFEYVEKVDGKIVQQPSAAIYNRDYFEDDLSCHSN